MAAENREVRLELADPEMRARDFPFHGEDTEGIAGVTIGETGGQDLHEAEAARPVPILGG